MRSFPSCQNQCCCCVVAVLLSLGSVILTSIGVCVILKYFMISMDLLPPELQNHDGQKIVGIILTCIGATGMIISTMVAILYFTVCHESRTGQPAVAQKISKKCVTSDTKLSATPKTQANGYHQSHSQLYPKSPTKTPKSKVKSQYNTERMESEKPISVIGVPLTSTPRRMRGKNGRPLSSNLDIVKEDDNDCLTPTLQINGIDIDLCKGSKELDDVFLNGKNDIILKPILKSSSSTTNTTTTNTPSTDSAAVHNETVSTTLHSMQHTTPDSFINNTTTTTTSTNATSVYSKQHRKTTTFTLTPTTTTTEPRHSNYCDSTDQDLQTQDTDCEICTSKL